MDPGNWATDLEGGARFGYQLLWVLVVSNVIALLLQGMSARLALGSGLDLASACRAGYSPGVSFGLWILAEIAIVACDLAELLGSAVALQLLFGLPLIWGAALTSLDVLLILTLLRKGRRRLEAVVVVLLLTIAACLAVELLWAGPKLQEVAADVWPPRLPASAVFVAVGMLGATVMPHNLYLQSGLHAGERPSNRQAREGSMKRSFWSTALALNLALLVNGAILALAASAFGTRGIVVTDLADAHGLLTPLLGSSVASVLFAVALLCAGQSASVTGTLAGQFVMEGFLRVQMAPWMRRALTRGLALLPALAVLSIVGDAGSLPLLIGSQVVLSLQLPFAVIPLIRLTSAPALMGTDAVSPWVRRAALLCAALILVANAALVARSAQELAATHAWLSWLLGGLGLAGLAFLYRVARAPLRMVVTPRPVLPH
ncbi:MAG: manganese transport protein [Polyangiaceae bacterium]|jgi:manganese transport protein|nr:manganese transport protein [Polyangiaceae bacterium]